MSKKVTPEYLKNAAYYYLGRFASSEDNLSKVLERKALRRLKANEQTLEAAELSQWISKVVEDCVQLGLINDLEYAKSKARILFSRGNSNYHMTMKLRQKGLSEANIAAALDDLRDVTPHPEWAAAIHFARRKRLGLFMSETRREKLREKQEVNKGKDIQQKQMESFMRAGFAVDVARKILSAESEQELEEMGTEYGTYIQD